MAEFNTPARRKGCTMLIEGYIPERLPSSSRAVSVRKGQAR